MKFPTDFFTKNSLLPSLSVRPQQRCRLNIGVGRLLAGLLLIMLWFTDSCYAIDWIKEWNLTTTQRYTDNLRMQLQPARSNLITTLSPSAVLGYLNDDNELRVKLNWNQLLYDDETALNFSEKIATLTDTYRNDRWTAYLTARYGYESSLTSQLGVNGSGNLTSQVPRLSETITPDIIYKLSEKNSVEFTGTYSNVTFISHPGTGFYDYTNWTINSIFTHQYSETLSFNVNAGYSLYNAGNTVNIGNFLTTGLPTDYSYHQNSKTLSYQLGLKYSFDEKTTFTGSGGLRNSNTTSNIDTNVPGVNCVLLLIQYGPNTACPNSSQVVNSSTNGKIYSANLKRDFEKGMVNFSFNQQLNPASTGSQQQTTQISATMNYNISERWNTGLNYTYLISDYVAGYYSSNTAYTNLNNRTVNSITPNIKWRWTPDMSFELTYTYTDQIYTLENLNAVGNNMQLQFVYQPQTNRQVK